MKKILVVMLMLSVLTTFAACGKEETVEPEATPEATVEPTEVPSVTAPPEEAANTSVDMVEAEGKPMTPDMEGYVEPDSEGYRTAMSMIGSDVSELIEIIGEPTKGDSYVTSCIAPGSGAEDGMLYYDDFTVSTIRYPNGSEIVMGAY